VSARPARIQAGGPSPAAGLAAALPVAGMAAGLVATVTVLWSWARPHGAPPPAILAAGLALAAASRCLGLLGAAQREGGDELPLVGLLLGAGLPVAFVRFGPASAPAAVITAVAVAFVWWQAGLVAAAARAGLQLGGAARPTAAADLAAETQGAVFGMLALTLAIALVAPAIVAHPSPLGKHLCALAAAVQVGCGALLVAQNHRHALLRRAGAEGADVLGGAPSPPPRAMLPWAALLLAAALLPALPAPFSPRHVGEAALAFVRFLSPHGAPTPQGPATAPRGGPPAGARAASVLAPAFLGLAAAALLVLLVFWIVRARAGGQRSRGSPAGTGGLRALLAELWYMLSNFFAELFSWRGIRDLMALLSGARARHRPGGAPGGAPRPGALSRGPWRNAGDPRLRIRASYRHLLRGAGQRGLHRAAHLSPRAFGGRLRAALARDHAALERLTAIYEEARYSPHPLRPDQADAAEAAAEAVVAGLPGGPAGETPAPR
jgi:hypothetical protein